MTSACLELFLSLPSFLAAASFFSLGLAKGLEAVGMLLDELEREWEGGDEVEEPLVIESRAEFARRGPRGTEREADWWVCLCEREGAKVSVG